MAGDAVKARLPVIAITMGDPCGIGPEIIAMALADPLVRSCCRPLVIGDRLSLARAIGITGVPLRLLPLPSLQCPDELPADVLPLVSVAALAESEIPFGRPTAAAGEAVYQAIVTAVEMCCSGQAAAMVTAPLNKAALNQAGHHYPGHTELIAELTDTRDEVMMLAGERLRVTLVTIHEPLAAVPGLITFDRVLRTIRITHRDLTRYFMPRPRLAVLSLNPHAGEEGLFGDEEQRIIRPAIQQARAEGIDAVGPLPADTLFHFAARGEYDGVVCMYHDQGLIPLKLLHFEDGVNVTLGLPIIRTSVDHGTAYDLAGRGCASPASLVAAIRLAARMATVKGR
jgi:4-hydroxythreonine-4-phosphate dehydrogenase